MSLNFYQLKINDLHVPLDLRFQAIIQFNSTADLFNITGLHWCYGEVKVKSMKKII